MQSLISYAEEQKKMHYDEKDPYWRHKWRLRSNIKHSINMGEKSTVVSIRNSIGEKALNILLDYLSDEGLKVDVTIERPNYYSIKIKWD